ncbi:MAG: ROK family protein, partial [Pseudomonadota bacterium]
VDESAMSGWKGLDLAEEVADLFDFPVFLGNDASCACAAELVFGQSPKPQDFLYIYIGYFIGGGVVLNGSLYTGSSGNAGAIGPFPEMDQNNPRRQLMDVASLIGLERRLIEAGGEARILWENPEAWPIDDAIVTDWLTEAAPAIARTMLAAISIIDFSAVVIDGSMPHGPRNRVIEAVRSSFEHQNLSGLNKPLIMPGSIGSDARALGAASLPLSKRFVLEGGLVGQAR